MFKIIVLCGSIRFKKQFQEIYEKLTLEGNLVLLPIFFENTNEELIDKALLMKIHKQKIDMADEVQFINVDGYLGKDSIEELEYAQNHKKHITFLEKRETNISKRIIKI